MYADLGRLRNKSLGTMVDSFLLVCGAHSTEPARQFVLDAPVDAPMRERMRASMRRFRKVVRKGKRLLKGSGAWHHDRPEDVRAAVVAAARAWERQERGPMVGCRPRGSS